MKNEEYVEKVVKEERFNKNYSGKVKI